MKTFYNWLESKLHEVLGSVGGYPVQHAITQKLANEPPQDDYSWSSQFGPNYDDEYRKHMPPIQNINKDAVIKRFGKSAWDHGFEDSDKKIIENPRNFELIMSKLEKKLAKLDFANIHFYFGRPVDEKFIDFEKTENGYRLIKNYFFGRDGLNIPENDIVYIKLGTIADPLTPWLILHTFAHGIMDTRNYEFRNYRFKDDVRDAFDMVRKFFMDIIPKSVQEHPSLELQAKIDYHKKELEDLKSRSEMKPERDPEIYEKSVNYAKQEFLRTISPSVKFSEVLYTLFPKIWSFAELHKIASNASNYKFIKSKMDLYGSLNMNEITFEIFVYWLQSGGKLLVNDSQVKTKLKELASKENFDFIDNNLESELNNISNQFRKIIEHCKGEVIFDRR